MSKVLICAEIGINHNGSVDTAKKMIDVAAAAGCDYVKFQKRDVELVYTKAELDAHRVSPWGTTNRQQKLGLEFDADRYAQIDKHCRDVGIEWFASCWDPNSVDFIEKYFPHVPFHKVASALGTDADFLRKLADCPRPVVLSTGMMTEKQIEFAARILSTNLRYVLHCTSTYPTKPIEMNISYMTRLKEIVGVDVGFSNHYSGLLWVPLAVAFGAKFIEFHLTLDRTSYGSDQAASIEPEGVSKLVEHVRIAQEMIGDGVKTVYESEIPIMKKLRKVSDF